MMYLVGFIIWAIIGTVLTIFFCLLLLLIAHLIVPKRAKGRTLALLLSGLFPFATAAYLMVALFVYSFVADIVGRPADYGEHWVLALGHGYYMGMIDSPDTADITRWKQSGSIVWGIINIAQVGPVIVGETTDDERPRFFLLHTEDGQLVPFEDETSLRAAANVHGVPDFTWQTVERFYYANRVGPFERWTSIIIAIPPLVGLCGLMAYLIALRRRTRTQASAG